MDRQTGRRLWQSGAVEAISTAHDTWVLGLGPFRKGTIVDGTELAGEEIPNPLRCELTLSHGSLAASLLSSEFRTTN